MLDKENQESLQFQNQQWGPSLKKAKFIYWKHKLGNVMRDVRVKWKNPNYQSIVEVIMS